MQEKTTVLVVEDEPKVLKQLLRMLGRKKEIEILGSAMNGEEAIELAFKLKPQVMILDLGLPGIDGIEVTKRVKNKLPDLEILIFTVFDDEVRVMEAVRAGASGYLLKGVPTDKIIEAIEEIRSGGSVIQPNLARSLLEHFRRAAEAAQKADVAEEVPKLTNREREVLELIAKGLSNKEAARVLGVSRATIRTHLEHIYQKLDVTNRVEAITEGLRHGLIEL
ncbi:MAG: response regulator transcription factor [Deltaproteobacteria bacterium]|nr:response regulator transcription factor [Deltaproteobacteria bacterium]